MRPSPNPKRSTPGVASARGLWLIGLLATTALAQNAVPPAAATKTQTPAAANAPREPRQIPEVPKLGRVTQVDLHEAVDPGLAAFVKRVLEEHREDEVVLLDINTLGGRLDSALVIRDALLEAKPRTVCWVHPRAISAGALIALACDIVAVVPGASMGAATPVTLTMGGGVDPVDAKVTSYMRQEMANTARMQLRDPLIAEAMVDASVEVPGLDDAQHLLTLNTQQALQFGIADLEAENETVLWQKLQRDAPRVEKARPTSAERLARLLSEPGVATLLMVLGLLGIGLEIFHPSNGTGLLFGLMCLGLFFFGHHMVALAGWGELLLVGIGILLIALEYALPGHSVFGVVGLHVLLVGLFMALISLDRLPLPVAWEVGLIPRALSSVFGAFLVTMVGGVALFRYGPKTRYGKSLVLETVIPDPVPQLRGIGLDALVGERGVALTDLRPVGKIEVINKRVEARVERGFISAGGRVKVVRVEGNQVVVHEERQLAADTPPPPAASSSGGSGS